MTGRNSTIKRTFHFSECLNSLLGVSFVSCKKAMAAVWLMAFLVSSSHAQTGFLTEEEISEAKSAFEEGDYSNAIEAIEVLYSQKKNDPLLNYQLGVCYFNSSNQKLKATSHFQMAIKYLNESIPKEVYYYLARCYHLTNEFLAAINLFNQYLEAYDGKKARFSDTEQWMKFCENGQKLYSSPIKGVSVNLLDVPINTSYDDYAPLVSNNGSFMLFSSGRRKDSFNFVFGDDYVYLPDNLQSNSQDIFIAYRRGLNWTHPYPQDMEGKVVIPYSLTNSGKEMLLYVGEDDHNGTFYLTEVKRSRWAKPRKLGGKINSKFGEKGICFAGNNKIVYFASNRPDGYGGYDIYKSYEIGKNEWSEPENLGPDINTAFDEIHPFMHPDNKTLYFSSNGHNSMGGYDIFRSTGQGMYWSKPENLGYPINTVFNELHYLQSSDRKYSYLSSDRIQKESVGQLDIVRVFRPEKKIPRTMVTGKILGYRNQEKLPLSLQVTDQETDQIQRYVYNPDQHTGKFFMILFPKKNYKVSILHEGKEVNTLQLNIPEETYNYEVEHVLDFSPIMLLGDVVGEDISVGNSDVSITNLKDLQGKDTLQNNRYDALINLMEMIIDRTDVQGLAELNDLEKPAPTLLQEIPVKTKESKVDEYYTPLIQMVERALLEADLSILDELEKKKPEDYPAKRVFYEDKGSIVSGKRVLKTHELDFGYPGEKLSVQQEEEINELASFLQMQPQLNIEISWYEESTIYGEKDTASTSPGKQRALKIQHILNEKAVAESRYQLVRKTMTAAQTSLSARNRLVLKVYEPL